MPVTAPHPSEQARELLRTIAQSLVQNQDAWLDDLATESLKAAGMEAAAADPVLRASSERAFRASFLHWATQNMQHPGASVGPGLGDEVVYIARDLIRRGLEETATTAYRVGQSQALRYCVGKAFEFTDDPVLLRELLDTVAWSISDFVESTVTRVTEMMSSEHTRRWDAVAAPARRDQVKDFNGGDPTGMIWKISWSSSEDAQAAGTGTAECEPPGATVADRPAGSSPTAPRQSLPVSQVRQR